MRKLFIIAAVLLFAGQAFAAQTTVNTASDTFETAWDRQQAMNTEIYAQYPTQWTSGEVYTADNQQVVHGGAVYICTSNHTAGASTEPGTGVDWATVWKFWGADSASIHSDTAGEIVAVTEKAELVANDEFLIEDSADANNKKSAKISALTEFLQDAVGAMLAGNTETNITVTYDDTDGTIDFVVSGSGDMLISTYDPQAISGDAFARSNMTGTQLASTISDWAESVQDTIGAMLTGNTETNITVTYDDTDGTIDFVVSGAGGDMLASTYDPQSIAGDAFARANHTGTITLSVISDAGTAAAYDVGTSANNIPQLDVNGDFPFALGPASTANYDGIFQNDASHDTFDELFDIVDDIGLDDLPDVTGEGTSGYVLKDDGDGTYSFQAESGGTPEDTAYDATAWNADTDAASKNVIRDYLVNFDADGDGDYTDEAWFPSTSGAPTDASYVTTSAEAGLSAETLIGAAIEALASLDLSDVDVTLHSDVTLDTELADAATFASNFFDVWTEAENTAAAYIDASGVTFENLDNNGDVGTGASQVAAGDHNHTGTYEAADADIAKTDVAETVTANWYFSGLTNAMIQTESFGTNTTATAQQVSGTYIVATAAMTLTLPTVAEGYSFCFLAGQGVTAIIGVTPATGDYLVVDGVRGTAATNYASDGSAGDKICMFAANADDWYVTSEVGTWAE